MSRSAWKSPFCHPSVLKLVNRVLREGAFNKVIKIHSRASVILPNCLGLKFAVYNGKDYVPVNVNDQNMIGRKFGEFSPTRKFNGHSGDKKAVRR
ncbi:30S ribosomal protein S19 [Wolbachia endosymbiont of Dipetalonema caudispina]|uniref:30S ribosomal protein S19 n=1 Tax=Wolbachia endosymbiont of Dipetalonema caudispina TaxID=1812112 RepID=UPI00158D61BF|nr:30S ribosomal protein S19 [Wolbachia endosymbiont of Dipetalonema caudispina]MCV3769655.1 30S ribosomal protein S19 [Wolbachia pipientis]QKX01175.1 30S ribosomal protein S19 [Wolbachia endosymbiont of Dipetalonema caudispina]